MRLAGRARDSAEREAAEEALRELEEGNLPLDRLRADQERLGNQEDRRPREIKIWEARLGRAGAGGAGDPGIFGRNQH